MNILTLDLGNSLGWALHVRSGALSSGSFDCRPRANEATGQRWLKFRAHLSELRRAAGDIHVVYYEEVMAHGPRERPNVLAAHAYGGFLAHLETWCALANIRLVPVSVGTIKKHWTGKGNAKKPEMMAEAKRRGFSPVDDNQADALALMRYALEAEALPEQPHPLEVAA